VKVLVRNIVRKSRGGVAHRDEELDAPSIRLGRGADCELHLPDPRMLLLQATVEERGGSLFVDGHGGSTVTINGNPTSTARLNTGDKVGIGPYELEILPPVDGFNCAFSLELVRPLGDDLAQLKARSTDRVSRVILGKRAWSYLLFAVIAIGFLVLPIATFMSRTGGDKAAMMKGQTAQVLAKADHLWLSGSISASHRFFADDCSSCHKQAFEQVKSEACATCHEKVTHHADPAKHQFAGFNEYSCASCHKEHNGLKALVRQDQAFCASCHSEMDKRAPQANIQNASDFGTAHGEFRASIVTDPAAGKVERIGLDKNPQENSGLKFPHDKHLNAKGIRSPQVAQPVMLGCVDCHKPETGGQLMKPVSFEANCSGCHLLNFEPQALDRKLPHGKPAEAMQMVRDTYASLALRGGFQDTAAPEGVRRRPGQQLQEAERFEALAWAEKKANETIGGQFGKGLCAGCHEVADKTNPQNWNLIPALVQDRWLPRGRFDHSKHKDVDCVSCHAAPTSTASSDVLLPKVEVCQGCHGGETAASKTPSTCVSCHDFHLEGKPAFLKGKQAALPADHRTNVAWTGPARD
jgi:predicted CXXCH cytochrome family protein